jgi:hypothetical protein
MTDDNVRERTISKPKPMRLHASAQVCANVLRSVLAYLEAPN